MEQELRDLGEQPDLSSSPADLMSHGQLAHPKEDLLLCYYHQLQPWFAKHFYFASCLNAFPFWHDSQVANRCFQLCPCLFCFLLNGLFPRWGFSLWQAASWLVIGMTFQIRHCLSHWQEKPTHSGFHSSKCWKNRGRQNNRQYGLKGRSFCREMKAGYARNWIPECRIRLCKMVALGPGKGRFICLETAKQRKQLLSMETEPDMQLTLQVFLWEQGVSHEQVNTYFQDGPPKMCGKPAKTVARIQVTASWGDMGSSSAISAHFCTAQKQPH